MNQGSLLGSRRRSGILVRDALSDREKVRVQFSVPDDALTCATRDNDRVDADEARGRLTTLQHRLEKIADRDPDQEVQGIAVPVLDAIINAARGLITVDDTVGSVVRDLISPEAIADGSEPVRAVDALVVIEQLLHSLPPAPAAPIDLVVPRGKHDVGNWFDVDF